MTQCLTHISIQLAEYLKENIKKQKDKRLGFVQSKQALDTCQLMGAIRQTSAPSHDTV